MAGDRAARTRVAAGIAAAAIALGTAVVVVRAQDSAAARPAGAEVITADTAAPVLQGTWPTTTTLLPGLDPATGIGVSGPIGPPWPKKFTVADAIVAEVPIYQSPGVPVPTGRTLPNPTVEGYPLVMLVREQQGEWLQAQLNARPNGATAWIRREDVALRTVPNWIQIEREAKRLTVFHGDEEVFSTTVAPGKASTPTPLGAFYVDIIARPRNQNGPYGWFQVSVTGFSEVYQTFGGGIGQIAIHGTNRPELIGTPASNGCVRMTNEDIAALVPLAPTGTPVVVVP